MVVFVVVVVAVVVVVVAVVVVEEVVVVVEVVVSRLRHKFERSALLLLKVRPELRHLIVRRLTG